VSLWSNDTMLLLSRALGEYHLLGGFIAFPITPFPSILKYNPVFYQRIYIYGCREKETHPDFKMFCGNQVHAATTAKAKQLYMANDGAYSKAYRKSP